MSSILIFETLQRGGTILLVIFLLMSCGWFFIGKRLFLFFKERDNHNELTVELNKAILTKNNEKIKELLATKKNSFRWMIQRLIEAPPQSRKNVGEELLAAVRPSLFSHHGTIAVIAAVTPLLGLLGTVSGMMETFDVIHLFGASNPMLMADGISKALITTQAGLVASFPLVIVLAKIRHKSNDIMTCYKRSLLQLTTNLQQRDNYQGEQ